MKTFFTLFRIESKIAFFRHIDSLFFAVIIPVVIALIIGYVMGDKQAVEGSGYTFLQTSFGALATIGICCSGLMGFPMAVAAYRDKKILKRFRVTPVSPAVLLWAQVAGCFLLVMVSLLAVYAACSLLLGYRMEGSAGMFLVAYLAVVLAIYGIGILIAGMARNMKAANVLTTLVFFPMLLFSGATIPYEVMPGGAQRVMDFLPLTQGIKMLKGVSLGAPLADYSFQFILMVVLFVVCTGVAVRVFRWE